jgi:hypothetical protein
MSDGRMTQKIKIIKEKSMNFNDSKSEIIIEESAKFLIARNVLHRFTLEKND